MKIGVIAGSELALPLLALLKNSGADVFLFADVADPGSFAVVQQQCTVMRINVQESGGDVDRLYPWAEYMDLDIVFIIGYAHLVDINQLPKKLTGLIFNIHFGPLPAFKGPNPVFWQLKKGTSTVGISIHHVSMKFDSGKVIWYKEIPNQHYFNFGMVNQICSQAVLEGVITILQNLTTGKPLPEYKSTAASGYYKRPGLADVSINWQQMDAQEILNLINACNPWNKGAITYFNGQELKIIDAFEVDAGTMGENSYSPGTIIECSDNFKVACINGSVLQITMLNLFGVFIPARNAQKFGFLKTQQLG